MKVRLPTRRVLMVLSLCLCVSACVVPAHKSQGVRESIQRLDAQVDEAFFTRDTAFLEDSLSEQFVYVHSGAVNIENKEQTLQSVMGVKLTEWQRHTHEVRVYSNKTMAMASGLVTVGAGALSPLNFYVSRWYEHNGSRWRLVSQQTNFALKDNLQVYEVTQLLHQNFWLLKNDKPISGADRDESDKGYRRE